jgi:transposase-like protein
MGIVMLYFDSITARFPKHDHRLRIQMKAKPVSDELRAEALRLLRLGVPHRSVLQQLPGVFPQLIRDLSKAHRIAYTKRGPGRRVSAELRERIKDAIKAASATGETLCSIERRFHCSDDTVSKCRRELGDLSNWRHKRKLSPEQVEEAHRLLANRAMTWRATAARYGVCLATLQKAIHRYRHGRLARSIEP